MADKYILQGHVPVKVDDLMAWGRFFEQSDARRVALTHFDGGYVSTVFIGLDHRFGVPGAPLLFETMIFGGPHDDYCERYATWDEAEAGHAAAVALATKVDAVDPAEGIVTG